MSAFAGAIHAAAARRATSLTAGPKPRLRSDSISEAQPNRSRTIAGEPSDEPLSITQTSARPRSWSARSDSRQFASRSRVFQETTATVTEKSIWREKPPAGLEYPRDDRRRPGPRRRGGSRDLRSGVLHARRGASEQGPAVSHGSLDERGQADQ